MSKKKQAPKKKADRSKWDGPRRSGYVVETFRWENVLKAMPPAKAPWATDFETGHDVQEEGES